LSRLNQDGTLSTNKFSLLKERSIHRLQVNENPMLGPQWQALVKVIAELLESAKAGATFEIQSYAKRYGSSPYTSPYIQGRWEIGIFEVELSGNLQLVPQLDKYEEDVLEFLGWNRPEVSPEEFRDNPGGNPNFTRYFVPEHSTEFIAEVILSALVTVNHVDEQDFWAFGGKRSADKVDGMGLMGRLKYSQGNPDRVIFALPGFHAELVEPSNEDHL